MSRLIRKFRSSYRSVTPDGEGPRLCFHIAVSVLFGFTVATISSVFNHTGNIVSNIGVLVGFVGTIFALLFTVLAIIVTFEGQYSENRAIQELQRTGHYRSIFQRFYLSVFAVGLLLILIVGTTVFGIHQINTQAQIPRIQLEFNPIQFISVFLITSGFLLTVLRLTTCFIVFYRIETILRNTEYRDD